MGTIRITTGALALLAALLLAAGVARAQQIRRIAEPNQTVRMAHGSYVCDGRLSLSPIDDTYDMVTCSGPIYNSSDYQALNTKLSLDELVKLNAHTEQALNHDLKAGIDRRFRELPSDLLHSAAIQSLEKSLMNDVDRRLPEGRGDDTQPGRRGAATGQPSSEP
ncbi:MAG TPA: hypothetical protein VI455_02765 [Terriglobia bacterium]